MARVDHAFGEATRAFSELGPSNPGDAKAWQHVNEKCVGPLWLALEAEKMPRPGHPGQIIFTADVQAHAVSLFKAAERLLGAATRAFTSTSEGDGGWQDAHGFMVLIIRVLYYVVAKMITDETVTRIQNFNSLNSRQGAPGAMVEGPLLSPAVNELLSGKLVVIVCEAFKAAAGAYTKTQTESRAADTFANPPQSVVTELQNQVYLALKVMTLAMNDGRVGAALEPTPSCTAVLAHPVVGEVALWGLVCALEHFGQKPGCGDWSLAPGFRCYPNEEDVWEAVHFGIDVLQGRACVGTFPAPLDLSGNVHHAAHKAAQGGHPKHSRGERGRGALTHAVQPDAGAAGCGQDDQAHHRGARQEAAAVPGGGRARAGRGAQEQRLQRRVQRRGHAGHAGGAGRVDEPRPDSGVLQGGGVPQGAPQQVRNQWPRGGAPPGSIRCGRPHDGMRTG
mmetsp:Transcript_25285/g.64243  ORF Transcript_25285/g.64243 Transcript_25285/m.64243 type:complete len:449 (-) Transcript_25285:1559-2905(-)